MDGLVALTVLPVHGSDYATKERTGPWCNDHKSTYCEHVQQFIAARMDVPDIERAILGEAAPGVIYMTVPIFPMYSVWEYLYYEVSMLDHIGACGVMPELAYRQHRALHSIRHLMPGESARDLGMTLRQQFEDDLEERMEAFGKPGTSAWPLDFMKCKSPGHSFRYQQVASKVVTPANIEAAQTGGGDVEMVYGMLYSYIRHGRCLFCNVNESNRDAVRVNPALQGFFVNVSAESNFDDLVPN